MGDYERRCLSALALIKESFQHMTPQQRVDIIHDLHWHSGYCPSCGWEDPDENCQCENDE